MRPSYRTAAAVVAGCAALGAPAGVAAADQTPIETIELLEYQGYTVNVDRVGNRPLSQCVVTQVRNPQTVVNYVRVDRGRHHDGHHGRRDKHDVDVVPVIVSRSISVSLDCTG